MDWTQVLTMIGANIVLIAACMGTSISLFLWCRSEAREDQQHLDNKIDAQRKETQDLIKAIHLEIKDFHTRLCAIEERSKRKENGALYPDL